MKKIIFLFTSIISVIAFAQDGSLDITYNPVLNVNMHLERVLIQSDGKALVQEKLMSNPYQTRITRLMTDGSIDGTFNCALGIDKSLALGGIQPDGKIIIVQNNFQLMNALVYRLNANGSIDGSFKTLTGANGFINSGTLQPDGKIIIGGTFSNYNGASVNKIIRLLSNGDFDASFQYPEASYRIANIKLLSNGKFLLLCQYTPQASGHLKRLNSNGSVDPNFVTSENCYMYPFSLQKDEKIINQESCVDWGMDTPPHEMIFRLNSDGTYDNTFVRLGFDTPTSIVFWVLSDDRIMVSGNFNSYGGIQAKNLIKLQKNGALDATFNAGEGTNGEIWDIAEQEDGKLILVGFFSQYNNVNRTNIVRLYNTRLGVNTFDSGSKISVYPNPANSFIEVQLTDAISFFDFEIYDINSRKIKAQQSSGNTINISELERGVYFLNVKTDDGVLSTKFIKN
jgi:uncharacterized delta-60 repeat protein